MRQKRCFDIKQRQKCEQKSSMSEYRYLIYTFSYMKYLIFDDERTRFFTSLGSLTAGILWSTKDNSPSPKQFFPFEKVRHRRGSHSAVMITSWRQFCWKNGVILTAKEERKLFAVVFFNPFSASTLRPLHHSLCQSKICAYLDHL